MLILSYLVKVQLISLPFDQKNQFASIYTFLLIKVSTESLSSWP